MTCPPSLPAADVRALIAEHLSPEAFAGYLVDPRYCVLVAKLPGGGPLGYTLLDLAPWRMPRKARAPCRDRGPLPPISAR